MKTKRYLIEIGTGVDLHGGDVTKAGARAIKDAMSHCCMAGIREIFDAGPQNLALRIKVCSPKPEEINIEKLKHEVDFYQDVEIVPELGGATERGLAVPEMGKGDTLVVVTAIITVFLKV